MAAAASTANKAQDELVKALYSASPEGLKKQFQSNEQSRKLIDSMPAIRTWMNSDQWMPQVEFNGRPYVEIAGEKVPSTKMQFKLFAVTDKHCIIIARIYQATKKFQMEIAAGSNPQDTFFKQTQSIEKLYGKNL